ncbi:MAG TPA: hypothetical protein VM913_03655 [Sphingomicrobium sp.]|nr:hypothetical protein [Sphingomicrobium sp.]
MGQGYRRQYQIFPFRYEGQLASEIKREGEVPIDNAVWETQLSKLTDVSHHGTWEAQDQDVRSLLPEQGREIVAKQRSGLPAAEDAKAEAV